MFVVHFTGKWAYHNIVASLIEELVIFEEHCDVLTADQAGLQLVYVLSTLDVFAKASPRLTS